MKLAWIFARSKRLVVISEPSGLNDPKSSKQIQRVSETVYKRTWDHTHIRNYSSYLTRIGTDFQVVEERLEENRGNKIWIFSRLS
jgi:DNA/RNA-binding domain of Phe-tRNA-synthetase-like protein